MINGNDSKEVGLLSNSSLPLLEPQLFGLCFLLIFWVATQENHGQLDDAETMAPPPNQQGPLVVWPR